MESGGSIFTKRTDASLRAARASVLGLPPLALGARNLIDGGVENRRHAMAMSVQLHAGINSTVARHSGLALSRVCVLPVDPFHYPQLLRYQPSGAPHDT